MAAVTRVKGNVKPKLTLKNGSNALKDFSDQLAAVEVKDGDGEEAVTFADFASGAAPLAIGLTAIFSYDADALYKYLWENSGATGVDFVYNRWGVPPDATHPNLVGKVTLPPKSGWSAEASQSDSDQFEVDLQIEGTPTWAVA